MEIKQINKCPVLRTVHGNLLVVFIISVQLQEKKFVTAFADLLSRLKNKRKRGAWVAQ